MVGWKMFSLKKKKSRESFPLILRAFDFARNIKGKLSLLFLRAFDFAGRYIRSFIPEGLLSIYEQILMI